MLRQTGDAVDEWKWSGKNPSREHDMVSAHCTVRRHRESHRATDENPHRSFNIRGVDLDCARQIHKLRCPLLVSITACLAMFRTRLA
jgi:hypothetical protein